MNCEDCKHEWGEIYIDYLEWQNVCKKCGELELNIKIKKIKEEAEYSKKIEADMFEKLVKSEGNFAEAKTAAKMWENLANLRGQRINTLLSSENKILRQLQVEVDSLKCCGNCKYWKKKNSWTGEVCVAIKNCFTGKTRMQKCSSWQKAGE